MTARPTGAELEEMAQAVELPAGTTDTAMVIVHEPGGRTSDGSSFSGLGGTARYGVAWLVGGNRKTAPFATLDAFADARELVRKITGEGGVLWQRKQLRAAKIAQLDQEERDAMKAAEAPRQSLEERIKNAGGGSRPPSPSSATPSTRTPRAFAATQTASQSR